MIHAHGMTVTLTQSTVRLDYSPLAASLRGITPDTSGVGETLELAEVTGTELIAPTNLDSGYVLLTGLDRRIPFAPNQEAQAEALVADVQAALRGELPGDGAVTGLNFVALDVETANGATGSICQIGLVRFRDGQPSETAEWYCRPPAGAEKFWDTNIRIHGITPDQVADQPRVGELLGKVTDFIGDDPVVAHNAQFDITALRDAARLSEHTLPPMLFGCSLAASRRSDLDVANHRLPTVATALGVWLDNHHDALADARAAGEIIAGLALRSGHRGSLMEDFHALGLTLGELRDGRITPVLVDRTGAGRALQAEGITSPAPVAARRGEEDKATGAGTDFRDKPSGSSGSSSRGQQRSPAPWQSVATPDTIPEPNKDADPDHPLFDQHVTLTGDFEPFDKSRLWNGIAEHGGQVGKNVTKKTTLLVIGEWASKTSKEKKAEEYRAKGQEIEFWPAERLFDVLGLNEQPPF